MKKFGEGCSGCLSIIGLIVVLGVLGLFFLFSQSDKDKASTPTSQSVLISSEEGNVSAQEAEVSNTETETSETSETEDIFTPTDTSDEMIRSIRTYGDYLDMYEYIVIDYISYYQSKLDAADMQAEFEKEKADLQAEFEKAENEYGPMRHMPLPEVYATTLADMLIL